MLHGGKNLRGMILSKDQNRGLNVCHCVCFILHVLYHMFYITCSLAKERKSISHGQRFAFSIDLLYWWSKSLTQSMLSRAQICFMEIIFLYKNTNGDFQLAATGRSINKAFLAATTVRSPCHLKSTHFLKSHYNTFILLCINESTKWGNGLVPRDASEVLVIHISPQMLMS